jgi:hypothetical protein
MASHPDFTKSAILFYFYQQYIFHLQFTNFDICQRSGKDRDMGLKSNMLPLHHQVLLIITFGTHSTLVIGKYLHNIFVYLQNPDLCCSDLRLIQINIVCEMWSS